MVRDERTWNSISQCDRGERACKCALAYAFACPLSSIERWFSSFFPFPILRAPWFLIVSFVVPGHLQSLIMFSLESTRGGPWHRTTSTVSLCLSVFHVDSALGDRIRGGNTTSFSSAISHHKVLSLAYLTDYQARPLSSPYPSITLHTALWAFRMVSLTLIT